MFRPVRRDYVVKPDAVSRSLVSLFDMDYSLFSSFLLVFLFHLFLHPYPTLELCRSPDRLLASFSLCVLDGDMIVYDSSQFLFWLEYHEFLFWLEYHEFVYSIHKYRSVEHVSKPSL